MDGVYTCLSIFGIILLSAERTLAACEDTAVNNSQTVCETRYNIFRHELIGGLRTKAAMDNACKIYPKYKNCMEGLIKDCPKDKSALDIQGYSQESTNIAFKGFCSEREVFLKGLPCTVQNFPGILKCFGNHSASRDQAMAEVQQTKNFTKFFQTFCPAQVEGAECISRSVSSCSNDVKTAMKNLAYSLIHSRCKSSEYGDFKSAYDTRFGSNTAAFTGTFVRQLYLLSVGCILCRLVIWIF